MRVAARRSGPSRRRRALRGGLRAPMPVVAAFRRRRCRRLALLRCPRRLLRCLRRRRKRQRPARRGGACPSERSWASDRCRRVRLDAHSTRCRRRGPSPCPRRRGRRNKACPAGSEAACPRRCAGAGMPCRGRSRRRCPAWRFARCQWTVGSEARGASAALRRAFSRPFPATQSRLYSRRRVLRRASPRPRRQRRRASVRGGTSRQRC
mmetsp:Transcript_24926/g.85423  ORF Transcript_24926/g.85423 Transcript_24926/m.85423 type:complete len:208 (+) Transcript_24926:2-625(+)